MFQPIEQSIKFISPGAWPWQPALFPGCVSPELPALGISEKPKKESTAMDPEGLDRLLSSVMLQAIYDARGMGLDAQLSREWLATEGLDWCTLLRIDVQPLRWKKWAAGGCKGNYGHKPIFHKGDLPNATN